MRTTQRLVLSAAVLAMFWGVAALAEDPVVFGGNCNSGHDNGRGKHKGGTHCEPICPPCHRVVCDGSGRCKWSCEPIPDCTPG